MTYAILTVFVVIAFGPIILVLATAFKSTLEVATSPLGLPDNPTLQNFPNAWERARFGDYTVNSLVIALGCVLLVVTGGVSAGFALSRYRGRGSRALLLYFLVGMALPVHGIIVPQYILLADLDLTNTLLGVILVTSAVELPLGVFVMRTYFVNLPAEVFDAARVDGCGEPQLLWRIAVPLGVPAIGVLTVLVFLGAWRDLLLQLVLLTEDANRTVSVGLTFLRLHQYAATDYGQLAAGCVIATIPIIILYTFLNRQFVRGLTAGSGVE